MAIGFRQVSSGDIHLPTGTTVITQPAGVAATDVLVVMFGTGRASATPITVTAPAGWTAIMASLTQANGSTSISLCGFWALGSVASTTFTNSATSGNPDQGWVCIAFTGVDNTT